MYDRFEHTGTGWGGFVPRTAAQREDDDFYDEIRRQDELDRRYLIAEDAGLDEADCEEFAQGPYIDFDDFLTSKAIMA